MVREGGIRMVREGGGGIRMVREQGKKGEGR